MTNGNRVEELESKVAQLESKTDQLEATVRGLTEELVEANERIRALEEELGTEPSLPDLTRPRESESSKSSESSGPARTSDGPELIGADPEEVARAAAEADKSAESQERDEDAGTTEKQGDDIIVA